MLKAYKYRLHPNKEQEILIQKTFGCCRFVYNKTLAYRKELYETKKESMSRIDCNNWKNKVLKTQYTWLKEVDKFALDNAIINMDAAYQKFFKEHAGYPKFKSKRDNRKSYKTNYTNGNIEVYFEKNKIKLPKLKWVKVNIHPDFIENVLGAPIPRIPGNEINVFSDFIMDNFEGNITFNFAESLVESLQEVREQKKDSPEMVTVSCDEMEQIFGYCGVPDEKLSDFKENWEMYFSNEPVALDNIHNSKTAKIVTPDATICIQPDKIALIELKEINGVPSLVIPVNGELKINGIEVGLK